MFPTAFKFGEFLVGREKALIVAEITPSDCSRARYEAHFELFIPYVFWVGPP